MPRAWSVELRVRVIKGVRELGLTIGAAAEMYDVGTASVKRWLARYRETGDVQPTPVGGVRVIWIGEEEKQRLIELVESMSDATVLELAEAYNARYETDVSRSAMSRALQRFSITRKKRASAPRRRSRHA